MAKKPDSRPIPKDWGSKAAEEALKKRLAAAEEERRPKGYDDLLRYAKPYDDLEKVRENHPSFPRNVRISAYDTAAPYYGSEAEAQYAAAAEYARRLRASEKPVVNIDPNYYEEFKRQVPVITSDSIPHYNQTRDFLSFPNPVTYASYLLDLDAKALSDNNYTYKGIKDDLRSSMSNFYRDTVEHEAGHIADKKITFAEKPPVTVFTHTGSAFSKPTYMAQEDHLVTGLGKIQREYYSITGKRFESPGEFRDFVFNLTKSEDLEQSISSFSEEAKRSLRAQVKNAADVKKYEDITEEWKNKKGIFKGSKPLIQGDPDLLEKSSQLIPALVSNQNTQNYTS